MEQKSPSNYSIDLTKNQKQAEYFYEVFGSLITRKYKYFAYGGAIRGGKTFVTLFILLILCKKFRGSKWVVVRADMPALQKTTIPSLEKLLRNSSDWIWNRDKSNLHVTQKSTGSIIYFYGENIDRDPELNTFLGVECNGFFLEQSEELNQKMWSMAVQRSGSWYIDNMPPPFIFTTFNPTMKWVKKMFYDPWVNKELKPPYFFLEALPSDNPFVTEDQWSAWSTLDDNTYGRMVKGDWNAFAIDSPFANKFDRKKHVVPSIPYDPNHELHIGFDFNVEPCTASISQYVDGEIRFIDEIRIMNSDVNEVCDEILVRYPDAVYMVTADASGDNRTSVQKNLNHFIIIKRKLRLMDTQFSVPSHNPSVSLTRILMNSLLQNFTVLFSEEKCTFTIEDMMYVEVKESTTGIEIDKTKDKHRGHLIDCVRYILHAFHRGLIRHLNQDEAQELPYEITDEDQEREFYKSHS